MPTPQVETVKQKTVNSKIIDAVCVTTRACLPCTTSCNTTGMFSHLNEERNSRTNTPRQDTHAWRLKRKPKHVEHRAQWRKNVLPHTESKNIRAHECLITSEPAGPKQLNPSAPSGSIHRKDRAPTGTQHGDVEKRPAGAPLTTPSHTSKSKVVQQDDPLERGARPHRNQKPNAGDTKGRHHSKQTKRDPQWAQETTRTTSQPRPRDRRDEELQTAHERHMQGRPRGTSRGQRKTGRIHQQRLRSRRQCTARSSMRCGSPHLRALTTAGLFIKSVFSGTDWC